MSDDIDFENIKLIINNLIWMYCPDYMTLKEAENLASSMFYKLQEACHASMLVNVKAAKGIDKDDTV